VDEELGGGRCQYAARGAQAVKSPVGSRREAVRNGHPDRSDGLRGAGAAALDVWRRIEHVSWWSLGLPARRVSRRRESARAASTMLPQLGRMSPDSRRGGGTVVGRDDPAASRASAIDARASRSGAVESGIAEDDGDDQDISSSRLRYGGSARRGWCRAGWRRSGTVMPRRPPSRSISRSGVGRCVRGQARHAACACRSAARCATNGRPGSAEQARQVRPRGHARATRNVCSPRGVTAATEAIQTPLDSMRPPVA